MDPKVTAAGAIGAGIGALQTPLLREYVDRKYPTKNIPGLKGFGYPGTLTGLITGGSVLAVGAVGMTKGKDGRQRLADTYVEPAIDYGVVALVGSIMSGLYPAVTEADCVAKGGYFYDGICHKEPPAGATSMQGAPQVQTSSYRPPASVQQPDMSVLRQMTAELQRLNQQVQSLAQENAQLRAMVQSHQASPAPPPAIEVTQVIPGAVKRRQDEYGFMADTQQPLVTRRTEQIRKRFDFMG